MGNVLTRFAVGTVAMLAAMSRAQADHFVYSPYVESGVFEFETRIHRTIDSAPGRNNAQVQLYEFGYGVNDWWQTALFGSLTREPGGSLQYSASVWENIFQLTPQGKYWVDAGLYLEYAKGANGFPDEVETKLLLAKVVDPLVVTANLNLVKQIGHNAEAGVGFEYAVLVNWPWSRGLQFGIEAFGETGPLGALKPLPQEEHQAGPALSGRFNIPHVPGAFGYQAGYLFGVTAASPRGTVVGVLEYEIPF